MFSLFLKLLDACSARSHDEATRATVFLCQQDVASRQHVMDICGLLPLVSMPTSDQLPESLCRAAAHAAFNRSISDEALSQMLAAFGGLQQLFEALDSPISERQQVAALASFCICNRRDALCQQMSQQGPFERLKLLSSAV